ncbi:MAG: L-threonylcarbamoyladenylate synthase [Kiritimatiellia bacterium]
MASRFDCVANPGPSRDAAADVLLSGGVALVPTDTVYGLAAHPDHPDAVARLAGMKRRDPGKPIALLASGIAAVEARTGAPLPPAARALAARFWPGALTLVVRCADGVEEGFRVPGHPFVLDLLEACGGLLRVTSANRSGEPPAVDAPGALEGAKLVPDIAIDGGPCAGGVASSVVRVNADGSLDLLRAGAIPEDDLHG